MPSAKNQGQFLLRTHEMDRNDPEKLPVAPEAQRFGGSELVVASFGASREKRRGASSADSSKTEGASLWRPALWMLAFCISIIVIYRHLSLQVQLNHLESKLSDLINNFDSKVLEVVKAKYTIPSELRSTQSPTSANFARKTPPESSDWRSASSRDPRHSYLDYANDTSAALSENRTSQRRFVRELRADPTTTEPPLTTMGCLCPPDDNVRTRNSVHYLIVRNFTTFQAPNFFPVKIAGTLNHLPENVVSASTVYTFKNSLDKY
ncbi:hypothetical protein FHG87_016633 [Trinorchestia longiramus]|nr:hypothetical protein FHG87_016633 [Trinorchestia longiramus]